MIAVGEMAAAVVQGLEGYLNTGWAGPGGGAQNPGGEAGAGGETAGGTGRPCRVVLRNQTAKAPPYPYVAYTVTGPGTLAEGTYNECGDGTLFMPLAQTWSFTVQSDRSGEAAQLALRAVDFFSMAGRAWLEDRGIVARRVGAVNNRDNLLTNQFEYRCGFDVVLGLVSVLPQTRAEIGGWIEEVVRQ